MYNWTCCIQEPEDTVLRLVATFTTEAGVTLLPALLYDAAWTGVGEAHGLREAALSICTSLERIEVEIDPELPPVEFIVNTSPAAWAALVAWYTSPEGSCPSGCKEPAWL